MIVTFDSPIKVIQVPEKSTTLASVTVTSMTDQPEARKVYAQLAEGQNLLLWSDASYDAIGQWTDDDVTARVKEILED